MKIHLLLLVGLMTVPAFAKKPIPDSAYQDAVLVSFKDVATGSSCSHSLETKGNIDTHTNDDGNTSGTIKATTDGETSCSNRVIRQYTLRSGEHTYVVVPGYVFLNRSMFLLAHELPGAHLRVRFDKKGIYIRTDNNKESRFDIVGAQ